MCVFVCVCVRAFIPSYIHYETLHCVGGELEMNTIMSNSLTAKITSVKLDLSVARILTHFHILHVPY